MLIVDLSLVTMIDLSGAYALEDLIKSAKIKNIMVIVSNANPNIKKILKKVNFIEHLGEKHFFDSKEQVIAILLKQFPLKNMELSNQK